LLQACYCLAFCRKVKRFKIQHFQAHVAAAAAASGQIYSSQLEGTTNFSLPPFGLLLLLPACHPT